MNRTNRHLVVWSLLVAASLVPGLAYSQQGRVRAMGGLTLALHDSDFTLNPYDYAGNPAWLIEDERTSWLKLLPAAGGEWGDLHRRFDPGSVVAFGAAFDGVKTLDEKGTFRGLASYDVETRHDVYRSLKRVPYGGEAFFVTDTMTGNFTYAGPTVQFIYSYELFPDIAIGTSVRYQIQKGLKDRYSRVSSLYRDLQARIGATVKGGDSWVFGASVEPWDNQEAMEAKSEESFEVELFNFRGDTYATRQRGSSIDHKVRKYGVDVAVRDACRAGTSPEISATATEAANANRSTPPSSRTPCMRGRLPSGSEWTKRTPAHATNRPRTPPLNASTKLSTSTCRTSCQRPAPSAARTASSVRRLDSRARIRFATLAHTMSSRNPTAAVISSNAGFTVVTICCCAATTRAPQPRLLSG